MEPLYLVVIDDRAVLGGEVFDAATAAHLFVEQSKSGRHVEIRRATREDIKDARDAFNAARPTT